MNSLYILFLHKSTVQKQESLQRNEIPYGKINDIEDIRKGGSATKYRATWNQIINISGFNANNGNLGDYLEKNFTKLCWQNKLEIAKDIANGLSFINVQSGILLD